jgi:glutamate synthase domain-containing protein 1
MCGIVGLFFKNKSLEPQLGEYFSEMLDSMSSRGPDSAGFAIYGSPAPRGSLKFTMYHPDPRFEWEKVSSGLKGKLGTLPRYKVISSHALFIVESEEKPVRDYLETHFPDLVIMSVGERIEIMKEVGLPKDVLHRFNVAEMRGTHAIGHTRMATESAVTTAGSHPFSTGQDLCLVHNGSLSNHNWLRKDLERAGYHFETENDSEVAAAYLTWRLDSGDTLDEALNHALKDLDGFYTFAIGTRDGFAVLRDPIACKPAVMAETDDYVAMASEYRSLVGLPGIKKARLWEPEPATVYTWKVEK